MYHKLRLHMSYKYFRFDNLHSSESWYDNALPAVRTSSIVEYSLEYAYWNKDCVYSAWPWASNGDLLGMNKLVGMYCAMHIGSSVNKV